MVSEYMLQNLYPKVRHNSMAAHVLTLGQRGVCTDQISYWQTGLRNCMKDRELGVACCVTVRSIASEQCLQGKERMTSVSGYRGVMACSSVWLYMRTPAIYTQ